ncbi:MAG: FKBP-type peptidyl-prolyl cis-trans isomerase [Tannerella sp.]|jgi:peptidylprolyl isomerase/FKBP-type peptidyl-prolyl cis-trans isomerase FklB|nr:FKBP-type peptidyl-prolyl cis-trans isomerase [Tannerella sp.]
MKKYTLFIGLIVTALLVAACSKDETDPTLETWKQQNEQAFTGLANNPEYTRLSMPGGVGNIYYRVLQEGDGKRVYYNSRAEVYYKGWYVVTNQDRKVNAGDVFDQRLFDDGETFKLAVSQAATDNIQYATVINGWNLALQYMVEGDKWEVWIPYQLAYGENGNASIPGYTTLAFEIELIKAIDPDEFDSTTGSSTDDSSGIIF